MKKLFLLLAAVGMLATACEKESGLGGGNNGGGSTDVAPSIVGKWSATFEEEGDKWTETYTFEANGTFEWVSSAPGEPEDKNNGTYTYEESTLTLYYEGEEPEVYTVSISGNALTLTSANQATTFYRQ